MNTETLSDISDEIKSHYPTMLQSWGIIGISILFKVLFTPVFFLSDYTGKEQTFLVYQVLALGSTFAYAHLRRKKTTGISTYDFNPASTKIMVLLAVSTICLLVSIRVPLVSVLPRPEWLPDLSKTFTVNNPYSIVSLVLVAPVLEELIFRGIILDGLLHKYSPVKSIVFSSMLFGLIHIHPIQLVSAFLIGLFAGWVYYRTSKISLCIFIHFINNFLITLVVLFYTDDTSTDTLAATGYRHYLIYLFILMAVGGVAIYLLNKEFNTQGRNTASFSSPSRMSNLNEQTK